MGKLVVLTSLTLDGVMQAPGRPDEDRRGGFAHGGWAPPYADSVLGGAVGESLASTGALLLGRRTYEDLFAYWPHQPEPNPFTAVLDATQKYVASTTLAEPLPWRNSTLLRGDAALPGPGQNRKRGERPHSGARRWRRGRRRRREGR
jgi:dihydrofolate reductase